MGDICFLLQVLAESVHSLSPNLQEDNEDNEDVRLKVSLDLDGRAVLVVPQYGIGGEEHAARDWLRCSLRRGWSCLSLPHLLHRQAGRPRVVLVLQQVVELGDVRDDAELVRDLRVQHVLRVEEAGDPELLLGHPEGEGVVAEDVLASQAWVLEQRRPTATDFQLFF